MMMKTYFYDFLRGVPLALGALLTLFAVVVVVSGDDNDRFFNSFVCGLVGIPMLFASLSRFAKTT